MQTEQRGEQHDDATNNYQRANNPVNNTYAVIVELQTYHVNQPCQAPPPQQGAADDTDESGNQLNGLVNLQSK